MVLGHSAIMFKLETFLVPAMVSVSSEPVPHRALEVMVRLSQITGGFFPLACYNTLLVLWAELALLVCLALSFAMENAFEEKCFNSMYLLLLSDTHRVWVTTKVLAWCLPSVRSDLVIPVLRCHLLSFSRSWYIFQFKKPEILISVSSIEIA